MKRLLTLTLVAAALGNFGAVAVTHAGPTPTPKAFITNQPVNGDDALITMQKLLAIANGGAPIVSGGSTAANQATVITNQGTQITAEQAIQALLGAGTRVSSAAYEASHVLKGSAGNLVYLSGYNSGGAQFVQIFNTATVPANATAPALVIAVAATSNFSLPLPYPGIPFTTGISISNSSTGETKTIGGADCYFTAVVK
jgi:hypothetical protein